MTLDDGAVKAVFPSPSSPNQPLARAPIGASKTAGVATGIGAMSTAMLGLLLTAVLITTVLPGSAGINAMPLVLVAVVVTYVGRAHLSPRPRSHPAAAGPTEPSASSQAHIPAGAT